MPPARAQLPFKQVRLESIAERPDQSVADHLKAVSVPDLPEPGPDEMRVRTLLSPVHPCDVLCAAGLVPKRYGAADGSDSDQFVPGIEAVARVEEVGANLAGDFQTGQRVFVCCWAPWGRWDQADGVWSEYLLVRRENVIAVPEDVSDATAAMFMVIPVTAYVMMLEELGLGEGDWLVQNASGSAVGRWVIALAEELGIHTINLVRREEQVEELRAESGAEHVLWCPSDGSRATELQRQIHDIADGARIKGALDAVGDGVFASLMLNTLSRYGTIIVYGVLGGGSFTVPFETTCHIPLECLSIRGFSLQNWWLPDTPDRVKQRIFDAVWKHIRSNEALRPAVAEVFPFERVGDAIRSSLERKTGKILLRPRVE
ncbi:zinc-dependent alcohol dehydrogenase family protein [Elongatibacter sediminis]|uniref:Zinc-dependent alcohol dehydrogenase family protein n=1 Tax=Elongatibacter sediminis TaxID=3119006 RepID=A0AAW9RFU6_9GAMM